MAYEAFAGVYDAFNEDADYDSLFRYVCGVLRAHGVEDGIVADLGCGTGELTLRLAAAGYDMIGVDLSPEMLSVLREKAWETGQEGLLLLCQDIAELDLYGTVRAAVSTFDTFNHIGPAEKFRRALCRTASDSDQALCTNVHQLLCCDRCRRASHSGRGYRNPDSLVITGKGSVFAVICNELCIVQIFCHAVRACRISRKKNIFSDIPRF